jgi:hypothetical protein
MKMGKADKKAESSIKSWSEGIRNMEFRPRPALIDVDARLAAAALMAQAIEAIIPEFKEDDDRSDAMLRDALSAWKEASK